MMRSSLSLGMLLMLLIVGCARQSQDTSTSDGQETSSEHSEFMQSVETKLADLDARIDTLKVRYDQASADAKAKAKEDLEALEAEREKVKQKYVELKSATAAYWEESKTALAAQLDTLDEKFDRAREKLAH